MKKLLFFWNEVKATFWFIPSAIILSSILLSIGLVSIDGHLSLSQEGLARFFFVNSSDSARTILSTISSAMMGVAGTVFSVTLVALTLASSQFGPRLIQNFMYVRLNQVVLGSYIATYLYCLLLLNAIKDNEGFTFIPSISILVAIISTVINILLLVVFIHRIAISIQANYVISDISDSISSQVDRLFPERIGEALEEEEHCDADNIKSKYSTIISLKCPKNGYLQYIDGGSLLNRMVKYDSLLVLDYRPGAFMVKDMEIGLLYIRNTITPEETKSILDQFVIGKTQNAQQDLEFSIHQMVEIAVRALSPGVNDPFTAIACIDNLTATMCYLAKVKFPSQYRFDDDDTLRIIADTFDFEGILDAAFNQIRQCSAGSPAVIIRLMEALIRINEFVKKDSYKNGVIKHAKMVLNVGKDSIKEENDFNDLRERSKRILD